MSVSLITIRPLSIVVSPAITFSSVVLPPPLRPRMTTCSPATTSSRGTSRIGKPAAVRLAVRLLDVFDQEHGARRELEGEVSEGVSV